ncbi:MAG: type IV-A pilus assembly ATPase PilB [Armatimonadota bacterium]
MAQSGKLETLGELLVDKQFITVKQLEKAHEKAEKSGTSLRKILVSMGFVSENDISQAIGDQLGIKFVNLNELELDPDFVKSVPDHLAQRYKVIPVDQKEEKLTLAMVDPTDVVALDDIRLVTGLNIDPVIATEEAVNSAIARYYGVTDIAEAEETVKDIAIDAHGPLEIEEGKEEEISVDKLKELVDEAPIVRVVNLIISQAINDKASDIHIEPDAKSVRVRYRIDGVLHDVMSPPKHIQAPMVSRIKIMANMDIAERRIPQDGKIHLRHEKKEYDLRVSSLPVIYGEKIVMRILDKSSIMLGLDKLGFYSEIQGEFEDIVEKPYGMILVTGPTGSGKSTTLYSCLHKLNRGDNNIITIEDPVEYQLPGINQVQVNEKAGLTFANALRCFLRQDPDIIMVGEIRDSETAKIAIEAALTGHLVLSTLHTNDAAGAITRLIEMGVEPFLVASSVIGVLAQRLPRVICSNCKEAYNPPAESVRKFGFAAQSDSQVTFYKGVGCDNCKQTGYKGRTGVYELLPVSDRLKGLILKKASTNEIKQAGVEEGMKTLQDDGLRKVLEGVTTIEDCLRVVYVEGDAF